MNTIVHKIRLHDHTSAEAFERWVREVDYATCPELPSVVAFQVSRVDGPKSAPFHYLEVISVTSHDAFDRDMRRAAFGKLVTAFDAMASVVEETSGEAIAPGFRR